MRVIVGREVAFLAPFMSLLIFPRKKVGGGGGGAAGAFEAEEGNAGVGATGAVVREDEFLLISDRGTPTAVFPEWCKVRNKK